MRTAPASSVTRPSGSSTACARSTGLPAATRNLPFDEWTEVFGSERLTGALLDRLTHRVDILELNGDSYRLSQSRSRAAKTDA